MNKFKRSFFSFFIFSIVASGCRPVGLQNQNYEIKTGAIVGGTEVDPRKTDTSYIVSIGGYCAGSIVGSKWILTAAHCEDVFDRPITAGSHDLKSKNRITLKVKKIYVHPFYRGYTWGVTHDFALIELMEPIDFSASKLSSIKMADDSFEAAGGLDEGTPVSVFGWGLTGNSNEGSKLRSVEIPIVGFERADRAYGRGIIDESMLVAGLDLGKKDACQGDSGGPLTVVKKISGETLLAGVVSFGDGCGRPMSYGIYAKVSYGLDWIIETMGN